MKFFVIAIGSVLMCMVLLFAITLIGMSSGTPQASFAFNMIFIIPFLYIFINIILDFLVKDSFVLFWPNIGIAILGIMTTFSTNIIFMVLAIVPIVTALVSYPDRNKVEENA